MKVKELIRQLQLSDPTGEMECCVDGTDIHFLDVLPGYYDGCYQVLLRDETKEYYSIVGGKIVSRGNKVVIKTLSIETALVDDPDMVIEYDGDYSRRHYEDRIDSWRKEAREIYKSCEDLVKKDDVK